MIKSLTEAVPLPATTRELSFEEARSRYQGTVFAFVARRVRPVEEAEDIVASVFADAYAKWHRCRGDVRLWLFGIARRKLINSYRRRRPAWPLREADAALDAMGDFISLAELQQVSLVLAKLPLDERDVLLMSVVEELSIAEIALVINRSEKATNSLLGRARTRARKMTESYGESR